MKHTYKTHRPPGFSQLWSLTASVSAGFRRRVGGTLAGERGSVPADQPGSVFSEGGAQGLGGKPRPLALRPLHADQ